MELTRFDAKRLGHRAGYALDRQAPAPGNLLAGHPKLRLRKPLLATHHPAMALRVLVRLLECLAHQPPIPADRFPPPPAKHRKHATYIQPLGATTPAVRPIARPRVVLRPLNHPGPNGILMDVPNQSQKVPIPLHEEGLVPTLEQMPDSPMPPVEPLRVGPLQSQHHARQPCRSPLQGKVNVVIHQTVRQQAEAEPLPVDSQPPKVLLSIRVIPKDRTPLVPTHDHVVNATLRFQPRRPSHSLNIHRRMPDPNQPRVARSPGPLESRRRQASD